MAKNMSEMMTKPHLKAEKSMNKSIRRHAKSEALKNKMTEKESRKQAVDIYKKTKIQPIHGERY